MKAPLIKLHSLVALALTTTLTLALAPVTYAQRYGAPDPAVGGYGVAGGPPAIDPTTGLPSPQAWKDPNWKDPEKVLADVAYDGMPLAEIAKHLRHEFNDAFDVLIPSSGTAIDAAGTPVTMHLKNVSASEVFNAMNVLFEIENTPLRWELQLNGKRPIAVVRVTSAPSAVPMPPPEPPRRMIYFVGDLVGDDKSGGMPIEKLLATVEEIYQLSYGSAGGVLRFHKDAQLLIVTGTVDQIDFVQQTLSALREKAELNRKLSSRPAESKTKPDESKSP